MRAPRISAALLFVALGALVAWRLKASLDSERPAPANGIELWVSLTRPGSAQALLTEAVEPLERAFAPLPGLKRMSSDIRRSEATLRLRFEGEGDAATLLKRVNAAVPTSVPSVEVRNVSTNVRRLYFVVESDRAPRFEVARWLRTQLLAHLPKGIDVLQLCATDPAVFVDLDPARVSAFGLTPAGVLEALQNTPGSNDVAALSERKVGSAAVHDFARVGLGVRPGACVLQQRSGASVELALQMGTPVDALNAALSGLPEGWHVTRFVPDGVASLAFGSGAQEPDDALAALRRLPEIAHAELEVRSEDLPGGGSVERGRLVYALQDEGNDANVLRALATLHVERLEGPKLVGLVLAGADAASIVPSLTELGPLFGAPGPSQLVLQVDAPPQAAPTVALLAPTAPNLPATGTELPAVVRIKGRFQDIDLAPGTPLAAVARLSTVTQPARFTRENQQSVIALQLAAPLETAREKLRDLKLPVGVSVQLRAP